ncbi:HK97 family phage prohead protease [Rhodopseudomonas boonkerdii]|uniref:HK97 family phage prohead protease n=1 Tax=Rhodopseudomonas boonkerdii TaxID=475937 RepID=UPI001E4ED43B|nr:HK97 family phage prohead protease [Rhodopseudomonas boonkerdii]UGV26086.1 HK97 family phage prohead protease [Rhodopseudomonas boonkerdii]
MLAPSPAPTRLALTPDGIIEGYASLFGAVDQARDMVMPGAFRLTLQQRGLRRIPMLFQHDPSEPIGVWLELREDMRGLWARGKLIPDVARARELLALLQAGAVDGLSIGYRTRHGAIDPKTRIRRLHQVDLWEISLVTFPLLDGARVEAVKQSRLRTVAEREWQQLTGSGAGADAPPAAARRGRAVCSLHSRAARKAAFRGIVTGVLR